jgi:6-phosphogluconolactonase (cycloisomerase 2 family)
MEIDTDSGEKQYSLFCCGRRAHVEETAMTRKSWAKPAMAAIFFLAGCNGFWNPPSSGGGGTSLSGNIYVLNVQTDQIVGYNVNSSGKLASLPGSPYVIPGPLLSTPAITVAPNNLFLYVGTTNGIYLYSIASNGSLTLGNSAGIISNNMAVSMEVDKTNSWLVNVSAAAPYIYAIPINSSNGTITSKQTQFAQLPAATVRQVVISPDNSFLFIAMGQGGTAVIPFNAANTNPIGSATIIPVKLNGGSALSVAVDPLGLVGQTTPRVFYIGETAATSGANSGGLRVFNFSNRTEVANSPWPSQGLAPFAILPKSTGDYVYVVNRQTSSGSTGVIAGFSIASSGTSYALTPLGSTFTAGTNPQAMVEDNTGKYVFVVNVGGSPDLSGYTFSTGSPGFLVSDSAISGATGTDPTLASAIAAAN